MRSATLIRENQSRLKLISQVLEQMIAFTQVDAEQMEAGGVLLGRHIRNSKDIVVDHITVPMVGDCCGPYRFYRDQYRHQQEVDRAWYESKGTCTYLGEWHTHPEACPTPSPCDQTNWGRILRESTFTGNSLFFVIVGTSCGRVWEGDRKTLKCIRIGEFPL